MDKLSKVKITSSTNASYNFLKTACKEIASEIIPKIKIQKLSTKEGI